MDLQRSYNAVSTILTALDFPSLFPGFHPYKFALYNSQWICLDGQMIPYQAGFVGNTSISYENELIAIWNMDIDPVEDMELLAYNLVHEMFHCYQRERNETRYPSDLALLNYPDDIGNFQTKYNENIYLAEAFEKQDVELFKKFHTLRNTRLQAHPDMVVQELRAETLEGLAECVGLTALRRINAGKFRTIAQDYVEKLKAEDALLFNIRKISFYTGAIYFLCLAQFDVTEPCAFDSAQTAYEQNARRFAAPGPADITPCDVLPGLYASLVKERENILSDHLSKSAWVACDASICGYDPMNMFRVGPFIYCSHFVCLKINGQIEMFKSAIALKVKEGSNHEVMGYYV